MIPAVQVRAGSWVVALPLAVVRRLLPLAAVQMRPAMVAASPSRAVVDGIECDLADLGALLRIQPIEHAAAVMLDLGGRPAALLCGACVSVSPIPAVKPLPSAALRSSLTLGCFPCSVPGAASVGLWLDPIAAKVFR
jgi:hypothetical protein